MRKASHARSSLKVVSNDYARILSKRQFRRSCPAWRFVWKRCYLIPPTKQQMREFDRALTALSGQFSKLPGDGE